MANSYNFLLQKQGEKRGYLEFHWPKPCQMLLEFRGSNQNRLIKCTSRENAQTHFHVGHTHQWISVLPSAVGNLNANNTCYLK